MTDAVIKLNSILESISQEDQFQAAILTKVWDGLVEDITPNGVNAFRVLLNENGLYGTIDLLNKKADQILESFSLKSSYERGDGMYRSLVHSIRRDNATLSKPKQLKKLLQVLRFGKRFTASDADASKTISSFLDTNNRIKMLNRSDRNYWILAELRSIAESYFPAYHVTPYNPCDYWRYVPKGTTAEGAKTPFDKYVIASAQGYVPKHMQLRASVKWVQETSRFTTVPKGYNKRRGICEEPLCRTLDQSPYADYLERALESRKGKFAPYGHVTLHDQETNRDLCVEASYDGALSTIDISSASDSVSPAVVEAIVPRKMWSDLMSVRSAYTQVEGRSKPSCLHIFSTMGSRLTFPLECHIFWCIVVMTIKFNVGLGIGSLEDLKYCGVYGDDIIIPTHHVDTLFFFLRRLGFIPNEAKSFYSTGDYIYRESCGVEYCNGVDVSNIYWPRRVIRPGSVASMVKLQNALYDAGYEIAATRLQVLCKNMPVPRVIPTSPYLGWHSEKEDFDVCTVDNFGFIATVEVYDSDENGDWYLHRKIRKFVPLPPSEVPSGVYKLRVAQLVPSYDNRRCSLATHSKCVITQEVIDILPGLYEEFCYFRMLGNEQMSYDDVCASAGVVQPRNYRKASWPTGEYHIEYVGITVYD